MTKTIDETKLCECKEPDCCGSFGGLFCIKCYRYVSEEARGFKGGKKTNNDRVLEAQSVLNDLIGHIGNVPSIPDGVLMDIV